MTLTFVTLVTFTFVALAATADETPQEYMDMAKAELERAKVKVNNYNKAKNVVLMIGDGMGLSTVTAGRIYKGQTMGKSGEEHKLSFETFPNVGLSKTYNSDYQVSDSAGTATAMLAGVKTRMGTVGVYSNVTRALTNCSGYDKDLHDVTGMVEIALAEGKSVGIVTTTRLTHATPSAAYAHAPNRYMEHPSDMAKFEDCDHVKDIARQLIEDKADIQVLLGGGRRSFLNSTTLDPKTNKVDKRQREGASLVQMWLDDKAARNKSHAYVHNKGQFDEVDASNTDFLFGLFSSSHMAYELQRDNSSSGEPSLTEMTTKAIQILRKNPKGYFLLVEGGRIDHGHHDNLAKVALGDTAEFDSAVKQADSLTDEKDTLLMVTADHSHVFSLAGYPTRGNDIFGIVDGTPDDEKPEDKLPYLTLAYTNGPVTGRTDLTGVDTSAQDFGFPGCINMPWETHGGEDVGIYAKGPMSHLIHSTHEQHYIAHVMMYASCLGYYASSDACDLNQRMTKQQALDSPETCGTGTLSASILLLVACWVLPLLTARLRL